MAAEGGWRSSSPAREHRCTAVVPPAILAADKQRRLCLAEAHRSCATFLASSGAIGTEPSEREWSRDRGARTSGRPLVRTTPLVMDHGRLPAVPSVRMRREVGQVAIVAMMAIAFAVILVARFTSESGQGAGVIANGSPSPSATLAAPGVAVSAAPTAPTASPSATTTPPSSVTAVPSPTATVRATTYTVRRGDTLSGIAAEFGTSVKELADLNDISDPSRLRVGQVLRLP